MQLHSDIPIGVYLSDDVGSFLSKAKFGRCVNILQYLLADNIVIAAPFKIHSSSSFIY
jgi:hypothetical protein